MTARYSNLQSAPKPLLGICLLLGLLILTASTKSLLYDTLDPDLWWHLRVADQLEQDGIGPLVDDLSYASIKQPWTPYSWLAELAMKRIWDSGGYRMALVVQAGMIATLLTLVVMSCAIRLKQAQVDQDATDGGTGLPIAVATMFAAFHCLPFLSFRPVTFAIVVLAGVMFLIVRDRAGGQTSRAIWLSIPICVVLTNMHFFAFLIPVMLGTVCIGSWFEKRAAIEMRSPGSRARRYLLLATLSFLACLCTPMLPGLLGTLVHFQSHDIMANGPFIAETQPFYSGPAGKVGLITVLIAAGLIARKRMQLSISEWLLLGVGTVLLFKYARLSPIFAVICAPMLCICLPRMSDRLLAKPAVAGLLGLVLAVGVVRVLQAFPARSMPLETWINRNGPDLPGYPTAAVEFVEKHVKPHTGRIVNEYSWGGYLAWALQDRFAVMSDGRTQLYSSDFWKSTYFAPEAEQMAFLARTGADAAILPASRSRYAPLLVRLGWDTIYSDARAIVLTPPRTTAMLSTD